MSHYHPALFYLTDKGLYDKLFEFFSEGIDNSERCVFLSTQNDAQQMLDRLISAKSKSAVLKLFSYFYLPDPVYDKEEFETKAESLKTMILNANFHGRVGFHVLGDMSRFSIKRIDEIEKIEQYLFDISNPSLKLLCTFKVGDASESSTRMKTMALYTHDNSIFENEDGSFTEVSLK